MEKKRVVFLGTKGIGAECLNILLRRQQGLNIVVEAALTNNRNLGGDQKSVKQIAEENGIPVLSGLDEMIEKTGPDLIISIQYNKILKQKHIEHARELAVNLHMAPLPEYRGCNQFSFAIIDGAKQFGTTMHRLEEKTDAGAIIAEKRFPVQPGWFVTDLYNKTYEASVELFNESIGNIISGDFNLVPQESLVEKRGSSFHYRKEIDNIKVIDGEWPPEKQKRYFRATFFPPFPPPKLKTGDGLIPLDMNWYNRQA